MLRDRAHRLSDEIQGSQKHSGTWLYPTRLYSGKGLSLQLRWIHSEQRFIGCFYIDDMARVHMTAHQMLPISPFLNSPRGLILFNPPGNDLRWTSMIMCYKCADFLIWIPLFRQLSLLAPCLTKSLFPFPMLRNVFSLCSPVPQLSFCLETTVHTSMTSTSQCDFL